MVRRLSEAERQVWETVARQVRPLKGRPASTVAEAPAPPIPPPAPEMPPLPQRAAVRSVARLPPALVPPIEIGRRLPGLDNTSWRRLSGGRLRPERTLDLHGRTADHAFRALHGFLLRAQSEQLRCVEIITGVGSGVEGGVLRRELPLWLSRPDLRGLVLAAVHPQPGNRGAVRVLLRRRPPAGNGGTRGGKG